MSGSGQNSRRQPRSNLGDKFSCKEHIFFNIKLRDFFLNLHWERIKDKNVKADIDQYSKKSVPGYVLMNHSHLIGNVWMGGK